MTLTLVPFLALVLTAQPTVNQQAIDAVAAGKCKVAQAAWWGFRAEEATAALQAAIDSRAEKVIVEKMSGPWFVVLFRLRDNLAIEVRPGVEVLA